MDEVSGTPERGPMVATASHRADSLAEALGMLLRSIDLEGAYAGVAQAFVQPLADWCTVVVVEDDGSLRRAAYATADPANLDPAARLLSRMKAGTGPEARVAGVIARGQAVVVPDVPDEGPVAAGPDEERLALVRHLGYRSAMVVPLSVGGGALGAATLLRGEYRSRYGDAELAFAEELAALAALSLDKARVHTTLRKEWDRLRSLVDNLGAILWEADPLTLGFSFVSRRAEEVLGYPVERWLSEPDFWASRIHPGDRDYTVSYRRVATAEGRDHELEYRMVAADGHKLWFQDIVRVDVDEDGHVRRLVGIMVDITRRKRAELALLESRQRFASLARTLQASLLPPDLPDISGLEVAARYRSAEDSVEVVGDFYDVFDTGSGGWGVVMGDVCGKGPDAAALTAVARHTVRAAAMREHRPSRVLERLNEAVLNHDAEERFCTAVYAQVVPSPDRVRVALSCGGHPLPLVLRAGGTVESAGRPGTLLGLFDHPDLADTELELLPGDAAILFTDGATEAKRRGMILGEDRLRAIVESCAGLQAEEIATRMVDAIVAFQDGAPQDDLAIVVLRVPNADGP